MDVPLSESPKTEFRVLGAAELTGPEGNQLLSILARPKLIALLSYLAASASRGYVRRDTLIRLFWAESDPERARNALRQSLHHLRKSLGEDVLLTRGDDEVGLAGDQFWSDVAAFEDELERDERESALDLYRGELLDGFYVADAPDYEKWLDSRRAELRDRAAAAAWSLAEEARDAGNEAAVGWARRALSLAPLDEALVRRVMELLDGVGDRSGAVQEYEAFAGRLRIELELEPAPETRELVESIRARRAPNGHAAKDAAASAAAPNPAASVQPKSPITRTRGFRLGMAAGAFTVIALIIVLAFSSEDAEPRDYLDSRRVLVMPFENQTGDPELDPLGPMVADWITRGLEGTGLVQTVPPEAALQLETARITTSGGGEDARVTTIAEVTGAGMLINGTVFLTGDSLQIEALVTDVKNMRLVATVVSPPVPSDDPMAAVETIRQRVAGALASTFDGYISPYADVMGQPPTYDAYRLFVEAQKLSDRAHTAGGDPLFAEAMQLFLQAVQVDSTLVAAYIRAGWMAFASGSPATAESLAYVADARRDRLTPIGQAQLDLLLAETKGDRAAALRAARRQPGSQLDLAIRATWVNRPAEAVSILAEAEWYPDALRSAGLYGVEVIYWGTLTQGYHLLGEHEAELEAARKAQTLYPQNLDAINLESRALAALGRLDELDELLDRVADLPSVGRWIPTPASLMTVTAFELRAHGYFEAARDAGDRAVEWFQAHPPDDPRDRPHRSALALAYYSADRWDAALSMYEELAVDYPDSVNYQGFLGTLAARKGDSAQARRISAHLAGLNDPYDFGRDTYWQACIAALLEEREPAMELLQRSFVEGRRFDLQVHRDLDLETLFDYPPFQEFLKPKG